METHRLPYGRESAWRRFQVGRDVKMEASWDPGDTGAEPTMCCGEPICKRRMAQSSECGLLSVSIRVHPWPIMNWTNPRKIYQLNSES